MAFEKSMRNRSLPASFASALAILLAAGAAHAAATDIKVTGKIKGFDKAQQVGTIAVEVGKKDGKKGEGHASFMNGYFTFADAFKKLDDTYDFNWINVVRKETGEASGLFSKTPNMDPESEDTNPHYYTEAEWITNNKFGDRTLHEDRKFSQFIDFPKQPKERGFDFTTFLILQDHNKFVLDGKKQFLVMAGWEWNYQGDDKFDGDELPNNGVSTFGKEVTVNKTVMDLIAEALKNGKDDRFKDWTALDSFTMVPTPGSAILTGFGSLLIVSRRRR